MTEWNRFCVQAIKLGSPDPYRTLVYGASWMFPPFRDFQALMLATGFDLSDEPHKALLITVRDADKSGEIASSLPKATKKRRWVEFRDCSYVLLKPVFHDSGGIGGIGGIGGKRKKGGTHENEDAADDDAVVHTSATISVHLDPHIPGIPAVIVNWVLHTFAPYLFHAIERTLENLFHEGSIYLDRMEQSPAVYDVITDAVNRLRSHRHQETSCNPNASDGDGDGDVDGDSGSHVDGNGNAHSCETSI